MLYFVIKIDLPSLKYFETKGGNFIYLHTFVAESKKYNLDLLNRYSIFSFIKISYSL